MTLLLELLSVNGLTEWSPLQILSQICLCFYVLAASSINGLKGYSDLDSNLLFSFNISVYCYISQQHLSQIYDLDILRLESRDLLVHRFSRRIVVCQIVFAGS